MFQILQLYLQLQLLEYNLYWMAYLKLVPRKAKSLFSLKVLSSYTPKIRGGWTSTTDDHSGPFADISRRVIASPSHTPSNTPVEWTCNKSGSAGAQTINVDSSDRNKSFSLWTAEEIARKRRHERNNGRRNINGGTVRDSCRNYRRMVTACPIPGVATNYTHQAHSQQSSWGARKLTAALPHAGCYFSKVMVLLHTALFISSIYSDTSANEWPC